jgi:carboxypeptidase family protein
VWLIAFVAAVTVVLSCRRGVPVVDVGPKPPSARGTITGIVRGPEGTSPVAGRAVQVVNVATGERREVHTSANGGFTIELPAGKYRLELPLRDGETLVKAPGEVNLDKGDIDSHIEFVVATPRVDRPRGHADRLDNGLGSPIA